MDEDRHSLKVPIESQHGGTATHVQSVPIHEERDGQTVWDGIGRGLRSGGQLQGQPGLCVVL